MPSPSLTTSASRLVTTLYSLQIPAMFGGYTFKGVRSNSPRLHHELLASLGLTSSAPQSHCILPVHSDAVAQAIAEKEEEAQEGLAPSPGQTMGTVRQTDNGH